MSKPLAGQIACVTGASRGIGRGIAMELALAGATVYITGRPPAQSDSQTSSTIGLPTLEATAKEINELGAGTVKAVYCDHSKDEDVKRLFEQIENDCDGKFNILVNNAYAAIDMLCSNFDTKFWEMDGPSTWDKVNNVGLRNHYICGVYAARLMVKQQSGLIVTISSSGGVSYLFNTAYGVGKAGCDRLACDMGVELKSENVASLSLWPGAVKTELFTDRVINEQNTDTDSRSLKRLQPLFNDGETTRFAGRCITAIAADSEKMKWTKRIVCTGDIGDYYGLTDVDGLHPISMRSVKFLLSWFRRPRLARYCPRWIKVPGWFVVAWESGL